ncbi:MAG: hypothetical protein K2L88_03575 [Clostridiales bacterium]|nr:hypothetical protein [Clostridiales bacterium]
MVATNNQPISIPSANKIYLFDDADSQQRAILNPKTYSANRADLIYQYDNRESDEHGNVDETKTKIITKNHFASNPNAAIIYTPMYDKAGEGTSADLGYINVSIRFFYKDGNRFVEYANNYYGDDCEYWAIEIEDTHTKGNRRPIQFAISVKDNHFGKTLYSSPDKGNGGEEAELQLVNFYYNYNEPGILAMHTYYRTDGNAESKVQITDDEGNWPGDYLVDEKAVSSTDLDKSSQAGYDAIDQREDLTAEQKRTARQEYLATAKFADDYKYRYFERTYSVMENGAKLTYPTYKHKPDVKFTYGPIEIKEGMGAETVPMSYIALPKGVESDTLSGTHVAFANAGKAADVGKNGIVLNDADYLSWSSSDAAQERAYIYENITVFDGITTYTVEKNPYLNIVYYTLGGAPITTEGKYINEYRFTLSKSGVDATIGSDRIVNPTYREDRYGFRISKKEGGPRAPGTLKLTFALKTIGNTVTDVEKVDVEVKLFNYSPTQLNYYSPIINKTEDSKTSHGVETSVSMSLGNYDQIVNDTLKTKKSTISLVSKAITNPDSGTTGEIYYVDPDKNDTMRFYMPSAFATTSVVDVPDSSTSGGEGDGEGEGEGEGGVTSATRATQTVTRSMLSDAEIAHVLGIDSGSVVSDYYGSSDVGTGAGQVNPYTYDPNPGYNMFFDVSPSSGSASSLQFIPKTKIPVGQTATYYENHHLKQDAKGNYYYPFRVLFYDEYGGSAFTQGSGYLAIIRVYITNDPIAVNQKTVKEKYSTKTLDSTKVPADKITEYNKYKNAGKYTLNLSKSTAVYLDVSSLLVDEDIVLTAAGNMVTEQSSEWDELSADEKFLKDYLVMPEKSSALDLTNLEYPTTTTTTLPFDFNFGQTEGYMNLPSTTIVFKAECAFKEERNIGLTFKDRNGTPAYIVFNINYSNDAPTPNTDTFGGTNTIDLTLKTNETFYLYAGDYTQFSNDAKGNFTQYNSVFSAYNATGIDAVAKTSAKSMRDNFMFFTSVYGNTGPEGNSLVLGSDDAASTLRIIGVSIVEKGYTLESIKALLDISTQMQVNREDNGNRAHLRLAVTAGGAVTATIKVTLADAKGVTVDVNVKVTVLSTAPTAKTSGLPSGVSYDSTNKAYAISLKYKDSKSILLKDIMTDIDHDDVNSLDVYAAVGGNQFNIEHPDNSAVVTASVVTDKGSNNSVVITATDFIDQKGKVASVSFRVVDRHGAISEMVTVLVTIEPQAVTSVVGNKSLDLKVMSYSDYIDPTNAFEPQVLKLVDNADAKLFKDADFDAASAEYDVEVYVLLEQSETGAFNPTSYKQGQSVLLYSRRGSSETTNNSDVEALYVQDFFTISATEGGKSLLFTPNSVTIRTSGSNISFIPLYVIVRKHYADSANSTETMSEVGAKIDVTVNNSRLMATENSSFNMGYPFVANSQDLRDSEFLTFTGSKGDSLTWKLYDLDNYDRGLFYDYDMLNMKDSSDKKGGLETIKYLDYSYNVPNENSNPVLNVSIKGEGQYQELTIKINRNVSNGQPPRDGLENKPTDIDVYIYAVDAVNNVVGVNKNDQTKVARTVIKVRVQNDKPEIAQTGLVMVCPDCGKSDTVRQDSPRTAQCSSCNNTFKSLNPEQLGYTISHSAESGYVLNMTLKNGDSRNVNIADIINDADIDMDDYVMLKTGADRCLVKTDGTYETSVRSSNDSVFNIAYQTAPNDFNISTLSYITFTCRSTRRGDVAVCNVKFRDSYQGSETSVLTIRLTVGNIAPTEKQDAKTMFTVMGVGSKADEKAVEKAAKTFSILDFITDANGDNFDALDEKNQGRYTYTYIDEIVVYGSDDSKPSNRPSIYGPNYMGEVVNEDTGESQIAPMVVSACSVGWTEEDNAAHQKFTITPYAGVYGVQKIVLRIYDSGYEDGMANNITDGLYYDLQLTVTIANPLDDVPDVLDNRDMVFGVTRTILAKDLLGEENAQGYTIAKIEELNGAHNLRIYGPNEGVEPGEEPINDWRIYAYTESVSTKVKITFTTDDGITRERTVPITVVANNPPKLKNNTSSYRYTLNMLDDRNQRTIKIKPNDWFEDLDAEDVMTFITPVTSSQTVKVEVHREVERIEEGGEAYLILKFLRRGESVITVNVTDLSGKTYTFEVTVQCTDAPELSWWEDFVSLIEANWMWFWIIVGAALLLIILLIVIIVVVCKKRKMRREIEALLESEVELEQEMMRLSSGAAAYQSFGYLPPTPQNTMDPGMMLGGGAGAPQPNNLQLNAGAGMTPPQNPTINNIPGSAPTARSAPQQTQQPQMPPISDGFDPNDF